MCDDGWGSEESIVACKQLGFTTYVSYGHGNRISAEFWLDDVICNGDESLLVDCRNDGWGLDNCGYYEGLYLNCTAGNIELTNIFMGNLYTLGIPYMTTPIFREVFFFLCFHSKRFQLRLPRNTAILISLYSRDTVISGFHCAKKV